MEIIICYCSRQYSSYYIAVLNKLAATIKEVLKRTACLTAMILQKQHILKSVLFFLISWSAFSLCEFSITLFSSFQWIELTNMLGIAVLNVWLYCLAGLVLGGAVGIISCFFFKGKSKFSDDGLFTAVSILSVCLAYGLWIYYEGTGIPDLSCHQPQHFNASATSRLIFSCITFVFTVTCLTVFLSRKKIHFLLLHFCLSAFVATFLLLGFPVQGYWLPEYLKIRNLYDYFLLVALCTFIFFSIAAFSTTIYKFISSRFSLFIVCLLACGILLFHFFPVTSVLHLKPQKKNNNRDNLIIIVMDTARRDHLSCYGYEKKTTPNIDRLAEESVVFTHAYSTSSWTFPAHASLFTGMYPSKNGAHNSSDRPYFTLPDWNTTLAELFSSNGYKSAGVVANPVCHNIFGLAQGFQFYHDDYLFSMDSKLFKLVMIKRILILNLLSNFIPVEKLFHYEIKRDAAKINKTTCKWLDNNGQNPFFLFINYMDPHAPYNPPEKFAGMFKIQGKGELTPEGTKRKKFIEAYDGEIAYLDYHLGKLFQKLKSLGIYDKTMIILLSDHGELFGEHNIWRHGKVLYEGLVRIPLIIKFPASYAKKGVITKRVSVVDIFPAILSFFHLPVPEAVQGRNPFLSPPEKIYFELHNPEHEVKKSRHNIARQVQAMLSGDYKFIYSSNGREELYNIKEDPGENFNLAGKYRNIARNLKSHLIMWSSLSQTTAPYEPAPKLSKPAVEKLRALGYLP